MSAAQPESGGYAIGDVRNPVHLRRKWFGHTWLACGGKEGVDWPASSDPRDVWCPACIALFTAAEKAQAA